MSERVPVEPANVEEFERAQGLNFINKTLLQQAFVHRSHVNERAPLEAGSEPLVSDNERLEFLGDAIIGFVSSDLLYRLYPDHQEGQLTHIRTRLVRRETLARFAQEMDVGRFLRLGIGEEESGGRVRIPTLCATFEAIVGAIYMDRDMDAVRSFLEPRLHAELVRTAGMTKDPKSRLQEWVQDEIGMTPRYKQVRADGPDHARVFTMTVSVNHVIVGVGQGRSKQDATQSAAAMALHHYKQHVPEYIPNPPLEAQFGNKNPPKEAD